MIRTLVAALAAGLVATAACAMDADPAAAPKVFERQTVAVAPHVWLVFKPHPADPPFEGNVVVIEQARGLVVVDAGGSPVSGRNVVAEVRRLSRKPVTHLIYSHYHGDHNLGAGAFRAAWPGVVIVSTAKTRQNMTGPAMAYVQTYAKSYSEMAETAAARAKDAKLPEALRAGWARTAAAGPGMVAGYTGMTVWPADVTFTERYDIADAQAPVQVLFLGRGNTDGDAVVWLPKQKVAASGDLVVAPIPYAAHTYPGEWIATLKRLEALPWTTLVPGHGAPQHDRAYVERVIAALETVRAQVAPLAQAGVPLEEVRKRVDLRAVKAGFTGDDTWLTMLIDAVFTNDLIANAYKEALGQEVVQGKG